MVDEQKEAAEEKPKPAAGGGKSKKLIIIITVAVLVLGGGGFAGYSLMKGKAKDGEKGEHAEKEKKDSKSVLIALDPFVVNLSEQGRYLKVTMQFELEDAKDQEMVTEKVPSLRDAVITLLSSKSSESVSGPEGKSQLKDDIILRANKAIGKDAVKTLYFTEFVMQ